MKYGPNTAAVERLIEQARRMTPGQAGRLASAWTDVPSEVWRDVWGALQTTALDIAVGNAWDVVTRDDAWMVVRFDARFDVRNSAWRAILALVTQDLISKEHFDVLYAPWASVFGESK